MSDLPVLELPKAPNFMVVDGQTFRVDKVTASPTQMLKHIEDFYTANLEVLKSKVTKHITDENLADLDRQVTRIERHLTTGIVALPDNLRNTGSVMYLHNNKVYETRIMLFRPTRISCTLGRVYEIIEWTRSSAMTRKDAERFSRFVEWGVPMIAHYRTLPTPRDLHSVKVDIKIEQDLIVESLIASYVQQDNYIYCRPLHLHPHVYPEGRLCTGSTPAGIFWDDPQFKQNFNMMNPHSFANTTTNAAQQYRQLFKNQYFVEATIRENEGGAWRVS